MIKKIEQRFPPLTALANESATATQFKEKLAQWVVSLPEAGASGSREKAARRILLLISYDGASVNELSTGEQLTVLTITYLWQALTHRLTEEVSDDLFTDLYHQFDLLENPTTITPDRQLVRKQMSRWPTGLDPEVIAIRQANKDRIIQGLIQKIERRRSPASKYQFTDEMTAGEKYAQVNEWWDTSRFHLAMAIKSPAELNYFLGQSLPAETM
ncbi:MAG: KamA family protein, partial [Tannerellaceae bacterium]|nr:KamA family protein [Tannerellaceae bacterium]